MSYIINKTDGTVLTTILDGTADTSTSMTLPGRGYTSFGEKVDENFIRLLESGASSNPPMAPLVGELWYDKTTQSLKIYTGSIFKPIDSAFASNTAPITNTFGELWLDTANRQLNIYTDNGFVVVGPTYTKNQGTTGLFAGNIVDGSNAQHVAANLYVAGSLLGVISNDSYIPGSTITGIATVEPGLNITANIVNPSLTGTPTAPTATPGTNNTQVATTAFITDAVNTAINNLSGSTLSGLALKANIASPVLTGNPKAPTPPIGDNDTSIATTEFVATAINNSSNSLFNTIESQLNLKANIASPVLTGNPQAPTPAPGDNDTSIATTAFVGDAVNTAISSLSGSTLGGLALKANIASPILTGNPQAPTPADGDNDNSIATTQFVGNAVGTAITNLNSTLTANLNLKANIASPVFTGNPQAPTPSQGDNDTSIATTAFVATAINNIPTPSQLWQGSAKFISNVAPTSGDGSTGDFWFQI